MVLMNAILPEAEMTVLRSLDDEATCVAADDPAAARLVVERVLQSVEVLLEDQPGIGRPGRMSGTRELVVSKTRHVVPYPVRGAR